MVKICTLCIIEKGIKGSDFEVNPETTSELIAHIERDHHVPVRRNNETAMECIQRFKRENPEAGGPNCECPGCKCGIKPKIFMQAVLEAKLN